MKDIDLDLKRLVQGQGRGAYSWTRDHAKWEKMCAFAKEIHAAGYKIGKASNLKERHIRGAVDKMKQRGVSDARIMNLMSGARSWAAMAGKPNVVPSNKDLGLSRGKEQRQAEKDQSRKLQEVKEKLMEKIKDPGAKAAADIQTRLMARPSEGGFGLRAEEAAKFKPGHEARNDKTGASTKAIDWKAGQVNLVSEYKNGQPRCNWTKGGRPRQIPITNEKQAQTLKDAEALAKSNPKGSTTPTDKLVEWMKYMGDRARAAGLGKADSASGAAGPFHSLRHGYVHERYQEITGQPPPVLGGPGVLPEAAREGLMALSEEIGHGRLEVLKEYLGDFEIK